MTTLLLLTTYLLGLSLFYQAIKVANIEISTESGYDGKRDQSQENSNIIAASLYLLYPLIIPIIILAILMKGLLELYKLWKR